MRQLNNHRLLRHPTGQSEPTRGPRVKPREVLLAFLMINTRPWQANDLAAKKSQCMDQELPPILLVTGFEPFGSSPLNPSSMLLQRLCAPRGWRLATGVLPVATKQLTPALESLLCSLNPALVLSLGEARGSESFRMETTARNRLLFPLADNEGIQIENQGISPDGPEELLSTVCPQRSLEHLQSQGYPAHLSHDAGGFLCNQLFYSLCHLFQATNTQVGFLHLPSLPEQGYGPGLEINAQAKAVQSLIDSLCGTVPTSAPTLAGERRTRDGPSC